MFDLVESKVNIFEKFTTEVKCEVKMHIL